MRDYVIRRLLLFVPMLIGVTAAIFILMRVVPGDVAQAILLGPEAGVGTSIDPVAYENLRRELHLDRPVFVSVDGDLPFFHPSEGSQYGEWTWGLLKGDWGESPRLQVGVLGYIGDLLPATFEIAVLTLIISVLIGLPLGVLMAIRQDTWVDYIARVVSISGLAMPNFWVGALILLVMVVFFSWIPPLFYEDFWVDPWDNIRKVLWACLSLGYLLSAVIARMTRSAMLEVLRQDYIRTAWAKGLRERTVLWRHALKNAILPVVTLIGIYFAGLMGGTVIQEKLWTLKGLGSGLLDAIEYRDYPMVQGIMLVFAGVVLIVNLIVDLLYGWLDPRVRYQ